MTTEYKLPLHNRKKEIVDYCIVSEKDFNHLKQFSWSLLPQTGYVMGSVNRKSWKIHRYIQIVILGHDIDQHTFVDHINHIKTDNRRENLRLATMLQNANNKKKPINTSSKYNYVSYHQTKKLWIACINELRAVYHTEIEAAHQVNIWINRHNLNTNKLNDVQEPDGFVEHQPRPKNNYPTGVSFKKNKFYARIFMNGKDIVLGRFNTVEEAIKCRKDKDDEIAKEKSDAIYSTPIMKNSDGNCIIQVPDRKNNTLVDVIIDEDMYYDCLHYTWRVSLDGYIWGYNKESKKAFQLSRYVMKYEDKNLVDHINNNKADNRRDNLRIATSTQNTMNKTSAKNSSSQFVGVALNKNMNKWKATIQVDGKPIHLGFFDDEIEAARVRDEATKKYYGEHGNLNFNTQDYVVSK